MEKNVRELTAREKQRIGRLVKDRCANYLEEDFFTGCLPLDCAEMPCAVTSGNRFFPMIRSWRQC